MDVRKAGWQRLDDVLASLRGASPEAATRAQLKEFEALLKARQRRQQRAGGATLTEDLAELVMPQIADPEIFQSARYTAILDELVTDVLPVIEDDAEVRELVTLLLTEELDRHRTLQRRLRERERQ
jgi:VIT1/CCC1 family predicted Fe2+/Mn2+ transporter